MHTRILSLLLLNQSERPRLRRLPSNIYRTLLLAESNPCNLRTPKHTQSSAKRELDAEKRIFHLDPKFARCLTDWLAGWLANECEFRISIVDDLTCAQLALEQSSWKASERTIQEMSTSSYGGQAESKGIIQISKGAQLVW